jgi:hypothetical protein
MEFNVESSPSESLVQKITHFRCRRIQSNPKEYIPNQNKEQTWYKHTLVEKELKQVKCEQVVYFTLCSETIKYRKENIFDEKY